jgi:hypothetical protein
VYLMALLIRRFVTRDQACIVGIAIPPQLADTLGMKLYAVAAAAGLGRCFFFNQSAALAASLMHRRQIGGIGGGKGAASPVSGNKRRASKIATVIVVDCGATGCSVALCDVGDTYATCQREFYSRTGGASAVRRACSHIKRQVPEATDVEVREAVYTLLREYSQQEDYQLQHGRRVSSTMRLSSSSAASDGVEVTMGREDYLQWFGPVHSELAKLTDRLLSHMRIAGDVTPDRGPGQHHFVASGGPIITVEVIFQGMPFKIPEMRRKCMEQFHARLNVRSVVEPDEVSVAEGAALLASRRSPGGGLGQRVEIRPLFLNPILPEQLREAAIGGASTLKKAASKIGSMLNPYPSAAQISTPGGGSQASAAQFMRRHSSLVA